MNKIPETEGEFQNPTKLSPFIIWAKQNFPFIEDTFEAMDYYGLLSKVVEYLNNVISNLNINEENISYLNENFKTLQTFVDDYFTNLDVQSEINNKLDEMASSGALDDIFQPYLSFLENQVDILSKRVDTFASLPAGSTEGNAELVDIRVGSDNKTYDSAGNSVRGQVSNIFQPIYQSNAYLSLYSGNIINGEGWKTLISYIPVIAIKSIKLMTYFNVGCICYYEGDKTFISAQHPTQGSEQITSLIVPDKAVYMRYCVFFNDSEFNIEFNNIINYLFDYNTKYFNTLKYIENNNILKLKYSSTQSFYQYNISKTFAENTDIVYGILDNDIKQKITNIYLYARRSNTEIFDTLGILYENGIIEKTLEHDYDLFRIFININEPNTNLEGNILAVLNEKNTENNIYDILNSIELNSYNYYIKNKQAIDNIPIPEDTTSVILDITGNGDFTSYDEAIRYCISNHKNLIIKPGKYIVENFNNVYIDFNIKGYSGAIIIANYTGNDENIIKNFSPINFARFNNTEISIENLTIECTNVRYCIHDEMGGGFKNYIHKIKNCKLIHNSPSSSIWNEPRCIGGGIGINGLVEIENCIFDCKLQSACDYHTDYSSETGQNSLEDSSKVIINNCYSSTSTCSSTCLQGEGYKNVKNEMYVSNSFLKSLPYQNKNNSKYDNFIMNEWNNKINE